ncbi:MAG TPA: GGDEF domain-containing protein [Pyrinomonadaceae bacterium]|jgi:diguanylate cyclase (GGDEF)-like protein
MDSIIGLIIQFAGIFLIGTLFIFLAKSFKSTALSYWQTAWLSLSCALLSLYIAFNFPPVTKVFLVLYYVAEYVFSYLLIAGCRNYAFDKKSSPKSYLLLIPACLISTFLVFPVNDFNNVFNFHAFILATAFAVAFFTLSASAPHRKNTGSRIMQFALALLALDFYHYTVIFSLRQAGYDLPLPSNYLAYNSIIDLVLEILLGFGMVIVLMERVRRETEETNHKLKEAHDQLEKLAHIDPLTTAFTRHAFYGFLRKHGKEKSAVAGCVGVFDIDNLKPINDHHGHPVGDVAISTVAHAIRSLVRADDLIFRWGGDEFFVVMLGFDAHQAQLRMENLNLLLEDVKLYGLTEKITIKVSFGFSVFNEIDELEKAIEIADGEMYKAKQHNKKIAEAEKPDAAEIHQSASKVPAELF